MDVVRVDVVDSTNNHARRLLAAGRSPPLCLIVADEQTAGRGTQGRSWASPRGAGLYFSVVERFDADRPPAIAEYTLAAGVACARVLAAETGLHVRLKPVNDLICGGGKLGGILTESVCEADRITALITGVGINTAGVDRLVSDTALPAVSLADFMEPDAFARLDTPALVQRLAGAIAERHRRLADGNLDELAADVAALSA